MKISPPRSRSLRLVAALFSSLLPAFIASAQLPNAWQINDDSVVNSLAYTNILNSGVRTAATNAGFDFSVNARFVTDYDTGATAMGMIYGDGKRRWEVLWLLNTLVALNNPADGGPAGSGKDGFNNGADGAAGSGDDLDCPFESEGYNFVSQNDSAFAWFSAVGDIILLPGSLASPFLGPLADNGGSTLTMALQAGGPASMSSPIRLQPITRNAFTG